VTENGSTFQIVSEGYDPDDVDRRIAELVRATKTAQQHAHELHLQLNEQQQASTPATDSDQLAEPDFTALGEHIGNLIKAADETARAIQADAQADADELRGQAQRLVATATADAEAITRAANQRVAEANHQRGEIFAELAKLRDRLPSLLGVDSDAEAKLSADPDRRNEN
jgi:cell division septum initiation protein DivIVA